MQDGELLHDSKAHLLLKKKKKTQSDFYFSGKEVRLILYWK